MTSPKTTDNEMIESLVEQAAANLPAGRIETLSLHVTPSFNRLHKSLAKPKNSSNNATGSWGSGDWAGPPPWSLSDFPRARLLEGCLDMGIVVGHLSFIEFVAPIRAAGNRLIAESFSRATSLSD